MNKQSLRGFGPIGIAATLVIVLIGNYPFAPFGALLALVWVWQSGTPWTSIGYETPVRWASSVSRGAVFGIALKLVMKALVMPLLGADPINHAFHYLAGNRDALPGALYLMIVGAGFGEETVFRGFLFERLGTLFGSSARAKAWIVVITAVVFGAAHYSFQGITGVEQATIVGLVFGAVFARTGRIWMLMAAHAAFDLTALALIYWDLESGVAHAIFK